MMANNYLSTSEIFDCHCQGCKNIGASLCSGCNTVRYCGRSCQVRDWKMSHKPLCKGLKEQRVQALIFVPTEAVAYLNTGKVIRNLEAASERFVASTALGDKDPQHFNQLLQSILVIERILSEPTGVPLFKIDDKGMYREAYEVARCIAWCCCNVISKSHNECDEVSIAGRMLFLVEGAFKFMESISRYSLIFPSELNSVEDRPCHQLWRAHLYWSRGFYYDLNPNHENTPDKALQAYAEAAASTKQMKWNKDAWPIISKIFVSYGNCLSNLNRYAEAITAYETAYEVHCSFTSPADRTVQSITARLATALHETGDVERAEYFSQVAYENVRDHHVNDSVESMCYFAEVRCQALFAASLRATDTNERVRLFKEGDKLTVSALAALGNDHPLREAKLLYNYQEMVLTLRAYSALVLHKYVGRRLAILRDVLPPTPETRRSLVCQYARSAFLYEKFHNECFMSIYPEAEGTIPMVWDAVPVVSDKLSTDTDKLDWVAKNLVMVPVAMRAQVIPDSGYDDVTGQLKTREGEPAAMLPLRHLRLKPLNDMLLALVIAAEDDFLVLFQGRILQARSAMRLAVEGAVYGNNRHLTVEEGPLDWESQLLLVGGESAGTVGAVDTNKVIATATDVKAITGAAIAANSPRISVLRGVTSRAVSGPVIFSIADDDPLKSGIFYWLLGNTLLDFSNDAVSINRDGDCAAVVSSQDSMKAGVVGSASSGLESVAKPSTDIVKGSSSNNAYARTAAAAATAAAAVTAAAAAAAAARVVYKESFHREATSVLITALECFDYLEIKNNSVIDFIKTSITNYF